MKRRIKLGIAFVILAIIVGGSALYLNDYYRAPSDVLSAYDSSSFVIREKKGKELVFVPDAPVAGLIFYPGGKVQYEAYAPLMERLAERGILCVLLHMPANLAVLDAKAAEGIPERYPEIEDWYIGGHSLGGAMAAAFVAGKDGYKGLVLLGAYSTKDLAGSGLKVLSIYGSEDGVMKRDNYKKDLKNLPPDYEEIIIEGGCHAYFGDYGFQKGDGNPTITRDQQLDTAADAIVKMIEG